MGTGRLEHQSAGLRRPRQGFGPPARRTEQILLVCYYDPAGIATVIETIAWMQAASEFPVTVLNLFEHRFDEGVLKLHPWLNLRAFDAVVIHNTVAYNVDNLRRLDDLLDCKLAQWDGLKVLMKQDENYRFRELAEWIGATGFDLVFTCLPPEAVPLVYPEQAAGRPRFERMLTGYVTPMMRAQRPPAGPRPIDIGYRGSIQPLAFGRLAYEKRSIGEQVSRLLAGSGLALDISSRWEDRLGGAAWLDFLRSCKATLGAESGASIFDLAGDLDRRVATLEREHRHLPEDARAEAVLAGLADLEGNVRYHQLSPRHFEAAACGTLQLLYPGEYSGVLQPGRHYLPLQRDGSNIEEAVAQVLDAPRRLRMTEAAYEEVVLNPAWWIETFVARVDTCLAEALEDKGVAHRAAAAIPAGRHVLALAGGSNHRGVPGVHLLTAGQAFAVEQGGTLRISAAPVPWEAAEAAHLALAGGAGGEAARELVALDLLLRLPADQFCQAVHAPSERSQQVFLQEWRAFLDRVSALVAQGRFVRGPGLLLGLDIEGLAAALLLKETVRAPVACAAQAPGASGPEALDQFRQDLWARLASRADARVATEDLDGAIASLIDSGRCPEVLHVFPPRRRPWLAPASGAAVLARGNPARKVVYGLLRTAWRLLPARVQAAVKPFARRVMVRF